MALQCAPLSQYLLNCNGMLTLVQAHIQSGKDGLIENLQSVGSLMTTAGLQLSKKFRVLIVEADLLENRLEARPPYTLTLPCMYGRVVLLCVAMALEFTSCSCKSADPE